MKKTIRKIMFASALLLCVHLSAQETNNIAAEDKATTFESFQLPSFSELSNSIATEYTSVRERLPNLANIGEHVEKSIRGLMLDEQSISATFRNLTTEHSILPNISSEHFRLRNTLNNIMFNGFDVNQLHMNGAYKGGRW